MVLHKSQPVPPVNITNVDFNNDITLVSDTVEQNHSLLLSVEDDSLKTRCWQRTPAETVHAQNSYGFNLIYVGTTSEAHIYTSSRNGIAH